MTDPVEHEAERRGAHVRAHHPPLPADAEAALRVGGLVAASACRLRSGATFVCPLCSGTGAGDEATGRVTSTGARQCATCLGGGVLYKRRGRPLRPWGLL